MLILLFYSYNHVLVPYCSSDVWLGEQTRNTEAVDEGTLQCKCLTSSSISNPCFKPSVHFSWEDHLSECYSAISNLGIAHGLTVYVGLAQARPNDMDCKQPYRLCGAQARTNNECC